MLNLPEGKRVLVVNTLRKKEMNVASGQEREVFAVKVERLGHCLIYSVEYIFSELSCLLWSESFLCGLITL